MIWQIDEPHPLLNGVYTSKCADVHQQGYCYVFVMCLCTPVDYGVIVVIFAMLLPFLYYEMMFRFNQVPQYLLNISRPFAAHWYVNVYS